jgi:hypothetical protein
MTTSAGRIWPAAGTWIRRSFPRSGWATARWHLFNGDAAWRLEWPGPSFDTECGYSTGPLWGLDDLAILETRPDAPCRRCLERVSAAGTSPDR